MKKIIIIIFIILNAFNAAGSSLYKNDAVFNLSELLHASRFEYDQGIEIRFPFKAWSQKSFSSVCENFEFSSPQEILKIYEQAVENHLNAYGDDEFDFENSLLELESELGRLSSVRKCKNSEGYLSFYDNNYLELVSFKLK